MRRLSILVLLAALSACSTSRQTGTGSTGAANLVADGKIWSSFFQQSAGEYRALCLQAFNIARLRLDEALKVPHSKPLAIVTDIDETFLDNSPYAVDQAFKGKDYDAASWNAWTTRGIADTLTGGLSFFNYAASKGVEVYYITNRDEREREGTLLNLQRFSFPYADNKHLILRQNVSSKEGRRSQVAATHEIVLLLGDNLSDFNALFDKKSVAERNASVQQLADYFGKRYIVLPNMNYGGWEDAVYGNRYDLTPAQKDSAIRSVLKRP